MVSIPGMSRQDQIQMGSLVFGIVILEVLLKFEPKYSGMLVPLVFVPFVGSMFVLGWWTRVQSGEFPALNTYVWPTREPPRFWFYIKPDERQPIEGKPGKFRYPVRFPQGEEFEHMKYGKKKKVYVDVWGIWESIVHPDKGNTTYHEIETEHGQVDRIFVFEKDPVVEDGQIIPVYELVIGSGNARQVTILLDRIMTVVGKAYAGDVAALLESLEAEKPKDTDGKKEGEKVEQAA